MKKLIYVILLTISSGNLFSQSYPTLKFRKPTTSDNTTWKFSSVTSGVDAYITVVRRRNATLDKIDDSTKYPEAWNPFIKYTNTPASASDSSFIEFKIEFKKVVGGAAHVLPKMAMTVVDCDGGTNGINIYREMVKSSLPATPKGLLGTLISSLTNSAWLTNISGPIDYALMDTTNFLGMTQINYANVSSYTLKVGVIGRISGGTSRQASFYFKNFAPLTLVLPVKLMKFDAVAQNDINNVQWSTSSEENANRFEVYRSLDGVNFTLAGTVKAAGYSQALTAYSFADQKIAGNAFYKLRMVDNDDQYVWSSIVKVGTQPEVSSTVVGSVYPNPTKGIINVDFKSIADSDFSIQVIDMFGKTVKSYQNADLNDNYSISIDLTEVNNGVYFIKVINTDGSSTSNKFIKH
jgi:hypothetical protein